jgi:tetratricopeptide (TPR) repeat protein
MKAMENVDPLLRKANAAEKVYDWMRAAKSYEKVAESFLNNELLSKASHIYKKLGQVYSQAAYTAENNSEYLERSNLAIGAFNKASNIFNQIKNEPAHLECAAEKLYIRGNIAPSQVEAIDSFIESKEMFFRSSEIYLENGDQEGHARTLSKRLFALAFLVNVSSEIKSLKENVLDGRKILEQSWKVLKDNGNLNYLTTSVLGDWWLKLAETSYKNIWLNSRHRKEFKDLIYKIEYLIKHVEEYDDSLILGNLCNLLGCLCCLYGMYYAISENEGKENIDRGLILLEKGLKLASKMKDITMITFNIFWTTYCTILGGRYEYIQKRIRSFLRICNKIRRILASSYNVWNNLLTNLPAFYYGYIFNLEAFTPTQRIFYTKKAIKYSTKVIESPFKKFYNIASIYLILLRSCSHLARLTHRQEERDEMKEKILHYSKKCESIIQSQGEGLIAANSYGALFEAHKALADVEQNIDEKIKLLKFAIEFLKKNIDYAFARTALSELVPKMMLGTLYLELGILSKSIEILKEARDQFLAMLNESIEKGFFYYAAVAQEYMAQIEDRLGNHTTSAMYYEKSRKDYENHLKDLKYELQKIAVKEKIDYNEAWKCIEEAKSFHKKENHLAAKERYTNAGDILNKLPKYEYESIYYNSWALLEEAEHLSKREKQKEAMEQYEKTRMCFKRAIDVFRKVSTQIDSEQEIKRVNKLEKVAKIRMDYCSARINLENARILGRQGDHIVAAEKFALAASQFRSICSIFKIERERKELEAIYYLCRAWESMELAVKYEEPDRFAEAAVQFTKASDLFSDSKYKLLASGNSAFCKALEYGGIFDESLETRVKGQIYSKVKMMLNNAATSYRKAGFDNGTKWILATSTYFDAIWNLIRANAELNLEERKNLLGIGSRYLNSAVELFDKVGYEEKVKEVKDYILMVKQEEKILGSALGIITKPSISSSTFGISAPACPIEIGKATDINEVQTATTESLKMQDRLKKEGKKFPELINEEPVVILILSTGGVPLFSYPFAEEWKFDDELFGGFLTSFNSISDEIFSEGLDRARFGQYTVLMESVENLLVCYLFRGQVFLAKDKLKKFIERIQGNNLVWKTLNKFFQTSQVLEVKDLPILEDILIDIFIQS